MWELLERLDWGTPAPYLILAALAVFTYLMVPLKDLGSSAHDSVQAAEKAKNMLEESYKTKVDDLEERVERLEELLIEKEQKIIRLESEIELLNRWIAVLLEQMAQKGIHPVTLDKLKYLDDGINNVD